MSKKASRSFEEMHEKYMETVYAAIITLAILCLQALIYALALIIMIVTIPLFIFGKFAEWTYPWWGK